MTRIDRVEIPKPVKLEVFRRAGGLERLCCEGCGFPIGGKRFDYDHTVPEVFQTLPKRERPPITAADVKLLGYACCHSKKSAAEHRANCHSKRIIEKAAKVKKRSSFATNRSGPFKRKMDGSLERR